MTPSLPLIAEFTSSQLLALWIVGMGVLFLTSVSLAGIIIPAWASVHKQRLETALKQQMLERGMSVDEIVKVLNGSKTAEGVVDTPCASEVVVQKDDEWCTALILKGEAERYFVHFVGTEMSDNEWVTADRVRFPGSRDQANSPWDWTAGGKVFDASHWCANRSKPAPLDAEI
jgi:hypothetical protein